MILNDTQLWIDETTKASVSGSAYAGKRPIIVGFAQFAEGTENAKIRQALGSVRLSLTVAQAQQLAIKLLEAVDAVEAEKAKEASDE